MKKKYCILIALTCIFGVLSAQTPQAFKYQAVVRNNAGQPVINQTVNFRISILEDGESGSPIYAEKHTAQSNAFGLVNLEIGSGTHLSGSFSAIDWGNNKYFIKVELDANNSGVFAEMGSSQLLSVPYALYAANAGNGFSGNYNDLTNTPNVIILSDSPKSGDLAYYNGNVWLLLNKGINGQTLRLDNGLPKWAEPGYALPIVTTSEVSEIIQTSAKSGGNVIATGFTDITARGVCWSTNQNPTTTDPKTTEGTGIGTFSGKLTNLQQNTTYYLRAYATNGAGTAYGNQVSFKTMLNVVFPTMTTATPTNITSTAATSGGNVTDTGGGEITARGVCWSDHQNPTIDDNKTTDGIGTGEFRSQISGLIPGTYYVRAYATNSAGTGYGNMVTLTTEKTLPVLTTKTITEISAMGCVSGGTITSAGGGTISERGICWSDSPNPTITSEKTTSPANTASFSAAIAKATPSTTYYVRAYAKNEIGVGYGDQKTFTTSDAQYYTSFETGIIPSNWGGAWSVYAHQSLEGSYSLESKTGTDSEATFTINLATPGKIVFYYYHKGSFNTPIEFYVDDVKIFSNSTSALPGWFQSVTDVTNGVHIFKWKIIRGWSDSVGYIDYVVITK